MAPLSSTQTRYRYYEVAPETISLPVSELLKWLPADYHRGGDVGDRKVELPCHQLFGGNTPRCTVGFLHDLLSDVMVLPENADRSQHIPLPGGSLAKYFHLVTKREELASPSGEAFSESAEESISDDVEPVIQALALIKAELKNEEEVEKGTPPKEAAFPKPSPAASKQPVVVDVVTTSVLEEISTIRGTPNRKRASRQGLFTSLPIFRRLSANEGATSSGSSKLQITPKETAGSSKQLTSSLAVTLEPLWKLNPHDQLLDPAALQTLFMTEEKLSLNRVIALAGELPGLRACVLAHGSHVVCASNTPVGIDLQTLSSQAMTMLSQIRESSAHLGLGEVPAVTLHAEQGALSFLHNGELCLLVLHTDRGFMPGVRERLQEMLSHLSSATSLSGTTTPRANLPG